MGRARTGRRGGAARRAVPLRPLPRDRPRRPERRARRLGHDLRRSPRSRDHQPRHARHPGDVPQAVGAREARHDRRPHLRRPRRARPRRRLVRVGAHRVRLRLHDDDRAARRARPPTRRDHAPVDGSRRHLAEADPAAAAPDHRRRSREAAHRRSRRPLRRRVQHRLADGRTRRANASSASTTQPRKPAATLSASR